MTECWKAWVSNAVFSIPYSILSARLNNRDHRKIVVIDGHTVFTGEQPGR